jgi:hypothetical protein
VEVKARATGEKTIRSLEDVEAFLAGRTTTPV